MREREENKQMLAALLGEKEYRPMKLKEMAAFLGVPKDERLELKRSLDELIHEGKAALDTRGRYVAADANIKTGLYHGTSRGFGFVTVEGETEDIFIPEHEVNGALDQDTVKIAIREERTGKRREGAVIGIVERGTTELVGTFQKGKSFGFVVTDNQKFDCDVLRCGFLCNYTT